MRAQWEGVREGLVQSTITHEAERQFDDLKRAEPFLLPFESPSALASFLTTEAGDLDLKDGIYTALVRTIQMSGPLSVLASGVLWLGLWPRLDAIYRSHLYYYKDSPEDLVSELGDILTSSVSHADLDRMHRPAASLPQNVKRDLWRRLRRGWKEKRLRANLPDDDHFDTDDVVKGPWAADLSPGADIRTLRAWLRKVVGRDAELFVRIIFYGDSKKEAGVHLGLTHAAARKRYQRARGRLSHFVSRDGVLQGKGTRRP